MPPGKSGHAYIHLPLPLSTILRISFVRLLGSQTIILIVLNLLSDPFLLVTFHGWWWMMVPGKRERRQRMITFPLFPWSGSILGPCLSVCPVCVVCRGSLFHLCPWWAPTVKSRSFIVYCNLFHSYYYYWNVVGISYCCAAGQTFSTEQRNNNNDGCLVETIHREGWANTNKEHHQKNGLWLESSWARRNLKIEMLCLEWCSIKHRVTNSYL